MLSTLSGIVIVFKRAHPENAFVSIVLSPSWSSMLGIAAQLLNAQFPMDFTDLRSCATDHVLQPSNAFSLIVSTVSGIVNVSSAEQL